MRKHKPLKKPWFHGTDFEVPVAKFRKNKFALLCFWILAVMYVGILFEGFIAPYSVNSLDKEKSWHPPHKLNFVDNGQFIGPFVYEYEMVDPIFKSYQVNKNKVHRLGFFVKGDPYQFLFWTVDIHLFGTTDGSRYYLLGADNIGRDLFSRIIYGAKVSLTIGFISTFIALFGSLIVGGLSGMFGGWIDWIIMRLSEAIIIIPTFYLYLYLRSILPNGLDPAQKFMIIMAIFAIPSFAGGAKGIRNWVLTIKNFDFVQAAVLAGESKLRILFKHIIPQFRGLLILSLTLAVPGVMLGEAGLSFLNLGITEPSVSWGMLLTNAQDINVLVNNPWILWPAVVIIVTVFCFFVVGFALKDAFEPSDGAKIVGDTKKSNEIKRRKQGVKKNSDSVAHQVDSDHAIELRDLTVDFALPNQTLRAIHGIDLKLKKSEICGIVGESGSGKSVTLYAMMAHVNFPGILVKGQSLLNDGRDVFVLRENELLKTRNGYFGLIMQEPGSSFDPLVKIGKQLIEVAREHNRELSKFAAKQRVEELLGELGLPKSATRSYPFQLSGGMLQRATIAVAMINNPRILLADEPTTALDPSNQILVLNLLKEQRDRHGTSIAFVTHDLLQLEGFADTIVVMYAGLIVERAATQEVIEKGCHPYTKDLLKSIPRLDYEKNKDILYTIPGKVPNLAERPTGCPYHTRCSLATELCKNTLPQLIEHRPNHFVRCHYPIGGEGT